MQGTYDYLFCLSGYNFLRPFLYSPLLQTYLGYDP